MMIGWRRFFLVAGLFNMVGGTMGLLTLERSFSDAGMAPPRYPFALQLLFLTVIILGLGYLMVWRDPIRHRGIVWIGLLTKAVGLVVTYWALHTAQLPADKSWQPLIVDAPWAVAFAMFLWRTRHEPWSPG